MSRRYFPLLMLSLALLTFSVALSAMSISINSSLDSFSYDLDNIHLKLEKLDTRLGLASSVDDQLLIEHLRAKRLTITVGDAEKKNEAGGDGLPENIKLPFPIKLRQAEIEEVIIITAGATHILHNVQFAFSGDAKIIRLDSLQIGSPWGKLDAAVALGTAKPFPLSGTIAVANPAGKTAYTLRARLSGNLESIILDSAALITKQQGQLAIVPADDLSAVPAARIELHAKLGLAADYPLKVSSSLHIYPEQLGNYPAAPINLDLALQGKLLPELAIDVQLAARDSQWQGQTLTSSAKMQLAGTVLKNINIQAMLGANSIEASGSLGMSDSKLQWQANLADLSQLAADTAGAINVDGVVAGDINNLAVEFKLLAQKLRLPGNLNIAKIEGQAALTTAENGKLSAEFNASDMQYAKQPLLAARLALSGTRNAHELSLNVNGDNLKLDTSLRGGMSIDNHWQGFVQRLAYKGATTVTLQAPAPLSFDDNGVTLKNTQLQLNQGRAVIDLFQVGAGKFSSQGQLQQITLQDLPPGLFNLSEKIQGDPVFSAKWNLLAADSVNGALSFWHEAGDLTLTEADGSSQALGLTTAKADIEINNNQLVATAKLSGTTLGNFDARMATALTKTETGFALLGSSALSVSANAQLNTLAWLPLPSSLLDADIDGQIKLAIAGNGTIRAPNLSGSINANKLKFLLPSQGIALTNGIIESSFDANKLLIKQAKWQGDKGYLSSSGWLQVDQGQLGIALEWTADKFTAVSRSDRLLVLNGAGKTKLADGMLTVSGDFTVAKGLIELASTDAPTLGIDVVVVGQKEIIVEPGLKVMLDGLRISLGSDFILRGRGIDALLAGAVTLNGFTDDSPQTDGGIRVVTGTYMAYGQVLTIERGILNFSGPVDNPGLNIRAMRKTTSVSAGVEVTGTAFAPIIKLVSIPNLAESEKLAWLVLGHGTDKASSNDSAVLSLAAAVLLSDSDSLPLQTKLARAAGLDELSLGGNSVESTSLTLGKRLSSQLYLSYAKSISGLLDVARLTYSFNPSWSLRAEAGAASAVDMLYTFNLK
jgi:translocation and assembly module TamB